MRTPTSGNAQVPVYTRSEDLTRHRTRFPSKAPVVEWSVLLGGTGWAGHLTASKFCFLYFCLGEHP